MSDLSTKKTSYLVPAVCGAALLGVLGIILNPAVRAQEVYAATTTGCQTKPNEARPAYCAMELGIMMNGTNETFTEPSATELKTDATAYREYDFAVRAVDTEDGYKLLAEAVNTTVGEKDYTNQLVNMDDPDNSKLVPLTTATTGASIPSGQWGYAFAKGDAIATTDKTTLEYKAVPTAADTTREIDTGGDTIYDDVSNTHTDMNYKLYFGARAGDNMRSGHYRAQVLLSVVADAKFIGGLGGITRMSEMTTEVCKNLGEVTTSTPLDKIPTGQLIDDREGNNGTKYWVSKLADGNCWMTQNLDYDGGGTKRERVNNQPSGWLDDNSVAQYYDHGKQVLNSGSWVDVSGNEWVAYTTEELATNGGKIIDTTNKKYNAHYLSGNYYSYNAAISVCPENWTLPSSPHDADAEAANGSWSKLLGVYKIANNNTGSTTVRKPPLYMFYFGFVDASRLSYMGSFGGWWSSTATSDSSAYYAYVGDSYASPRISYSRSRGATIRCVMSGK